MSNKRILKEIRDMTNSKSKVLSAKVDGDTIHKWKAKIHGPTDTPYEGGVFKLRLTLPQDYPFKPPKVVFETKVFHCNINSNGEICLDILKDSWSPALTIESLLLSIITLLECPNPGDPLEPRIAEMMKVDGLKFLQTATQATKKYAMNNDSSDDEGSDEESDESTD